MHSVDHTGSLTIHANLVSVFGMGVLIRGESGSGKTRLALALVALGHKLIADDSVRLFAHKGDPWGSAPDQTLGLVELQGCGVFDARSVFHPAAVTRESRISLCVRLAKLRRTAESSSIHEADPSSFLGLSLKTVVHDGIGWPEAEWVERAARDLI